MNIVWPDKDKKFAFTQNANNLLIHDVEGSINIQITFGEMKRKFTLHSGPGNHTIEIQMKELLSAFVEDSPFDLKSPDLLKSNLPLFIITLSDPATQEQQQLDAVVIPGGTDIPEKFEALSESFIWTWRPQSGVTYRDGKEYLGAMFRRYSKRGTPPISFPTVLSEVYFSDGTSKTITLYSNRIEGAGYFSMIIDASFKRIAMAAGREDIEAYDIYYHILPDPTEEQLSEAKGNAQRFVVAGSQIGMTGFIFRNTISGYDTVYASGKTSRTTEQEVQTILSKQVEKEVSRNTVEKFTARTGYLADESQELMWDEFINSAEKYIIKNDQLKAIIIDECDFERTEGHLHSLSFTYHMAEKEAGRHIEKKQLKSFKL